MEIGNILKSARESMGISIEAAEEGTKIRRRYLEAIEEENFEILPGRVYGKGFIKNYASFLGLDANELVAAYEEKVPEEDDLTDTMDIPSATAPKKNGSSKIVLVIAAIALVAGYYFLPAIYETEKTSPPPVTGQQEALPPDTGAGDNHMQQQIPQNRQQGIDVVLSVTDSRSWMDVKVDGDTVYTGTVSAGEKREFKGNNKIVFTLGNAGVVEVQVNGQKKGVLGGPGQVVTKEYSSES